MVKKYASLLIIFHLACVTLHGQKRIPDDFYRQEWKSWVERSNAEKKYAADTTCDIKFYHLLLDISLASEYITGSTLIRINPLVNQLTMVGLDLHSAFTVDSVGGAAASFIHTDDHLDISLERPYDVGETFDLAVYYQGIPALAGGYKGMVYSSHGDNEPIIATLSTPYLAHYWFPCKDGPGDKADSAYIDIMVPDTIINGLKVIAVSNGVLEDSATSNGKTLFCWRHRYPVVPYYMMAAVSNYREIVQNTGGTIPFPFIYYAFNENYDKVLEGIALLPEAMQYFSGLFGPYPFSNEKFGETEIGFYGGIENQTNVIIRNITFNWLFVSAHEMSHMWFGDMISPVNWHHAWLNEGFASYAEALLVEHLYGYDSYKDYMSNKEYYQGGTLYLPDDLDTFNIFQSILYYKGPWVLHMLRGMTGDSIFFQCIGDYATDAQWAYGHATIENFRSVCENVTGNDLETFFDQWIYDAYFPIYHYDYYQIQETGELKVLIKQVQNEMYGYRPVFEMPVQLKIIFKAGGDTLVTLWNDEQEQEYSLFLSKKTDDILFDPENLILKIQYHIPGLLNTDDDLADKGSIIIFPNPATEKMTLVALNDTIEQILFYSIDGKLIRTVDLAPGERICMLHVRDISPGVYLLKINALHNTYAKKVQIIRMVGS